MERGLLTRILSPRILMPISAERNEELDKCTSFRKAICGVKRETHEFSL